MLTQEEKAILAHELDFQSIDTSDMLVMKIKKDIPDFAVCPLMMGDGTRKEATFQKHVKFSIHKKAIEKGNERETVKMVMIVLNAFYDVPTDFFHGKTIISHKQGSYAFEDSEQETLLRIWTTKQQGKKLIYEITVSGYKDSIPIANK